MGPQGDWPRWRTQKINTMNWTLSAFTDEAGPTCEDQIAAALRAGLKYLDLRSVNSHNISVLPLDDAHEVRAQLDSAGLKVGMLGSPLGKVDIGDPVDSDLEKLRHLGALAPILGCNSVRIFSYYNKQEKPNAEWEQVSLARLTQLREMARELGLVLFHENERHIYGDEKEHVLKIAALRDAHFQLIFDFDNYNQGGQDVWEVWTELKTLTDAFHLKDSKKTTDGYAHVPIGEGDGQAPRILHDAVAAGWSGPVIVEPHLSHSSAVVATGPSGIANESFKGMPAPESFHIAVTAAQKLLKEVGAGA